MRFLRNLVFVLGIIKDLRVIHTKDHCTVVRHPKGLRVEFTPAGTKGNVLDELYIEFTGALLQSSVALSIQHDGSRPWQAELEHLTANEEEALAESRRN